MIALEASGSARTHHRKNRRGGNHPSVTDWVCDKQEVILEFEEVEYPSLKNTQYPHNVEDWLFFGQDVQLRAGA